METRTVVGSVRLVGVRFGDPVLDRALRSVDQGRTVVDIKHSMPVPTPLDELGRRVISSVVKRIERHRATRSRLFRHQPYLFSP